MSPIVNAIITGLVIATGILEVVSSILQRWIVSLQHEVVGIRWETLRLNCSSVVLEAEGAELRRITDRLRDEPT